MIVSGDQSQENMNHDHARSQSNENNSYKKDKIDSDETENERTYVASDYENDYYDHVHEQIKQEAERFLPYPNNGTHASILYTLTNNISLRLFIER